MRVFNGQKTITVRKDRERAGCDIKQAVFFRNVLDMQMTGKMKLSVMCSQGFGDAFCVQNDKVVFSERRMRDHTVMRGRQNK